MKKRTLISVISGCMIAFAVYLIAVNLMIPQGHADYPFYRSLDEIVRKANNIVIGEIVDYEGVKVTISGQGYTRLSP